MAVITTVSLNADSISIARYLYNNPEVASQVAASAGEVVKDSTFIKNLTDIQVVNKKDSLTLDQMKDNIANSIRNINDANAALNGALPFGWKAKTGDISFGRVVTKTTGLLATILAIFMGAPFWFDILNKISNLRGTGPKPPSSTGSDGNDSKGK